MLKKDGEDQFHEPKKYYIEPRKKGTFYVQ